MSHIVLSSSIPLVSCIHEPVDTTDSQVQVDGQSDADKVAAGCRMIPRQFNRVVGTDAVDRWMVDMVQWHRHMLCNRQGRVDDPM